MTKKEMEKSLEHIKQGIGRIDDKCGSCDGLVILHKSVCTRKNEKEKEEIKNDSKELLPELWKKLGDYLCGKEEKVVSENVEIKEMAKAITKLTEVMTEREEKEKEKKPQVLVKMKSPPQWLGEDFDRYEGEVKH